MSNGLGGQRTLPFFYAADSNKNWLKNEEFRGISREVSERERN